MRPRPREQRREASGVDGIRREVEGVATRMRAEPPRRGPWVTRRLEDSTQAGDVGLEGGLDAHRRLVGPDLVDEVLEGDRSPLGHDEEREQGAGLGPAELERRVVDAHLEVA